MISIYRFIIYRWLSTDEEFAELFPKYKKVEVKTMGKNKYRSESFRTGLINTARDKLRENPEITKAQLCEELKISLHTLYSWIRTDREWAELFNTQQAKRKQNCETKQIENEELDEADAVKNIPSFSIDALCSMDIVADTQHQLPL